MGDLRRIPVLIQVEGFGFGSVQEEVKRIRGNVSSQLLRETMMLMAHLGLISLFLSVY